MERVDEDEVWERLKGREIEVFEAFGVSIEGDRWKGLSDGNPRVDVGLRVELA